MVDFNDAMFVFRAAFRTYALTSVATGQNNAAFSRTFCARGILPLVALNFDVVSALVHLPFNQVVTSGVVEISHFVASQPLNMAARK